MLKKHRHIVFFFSILLIPLFAFTQSDIDRIKERLELELLETEVDDEKVSALVESIGMDGSWPGINYVDLRSTAYEHRFHLENLLELSKAFRNQTSRHKDSEALLKAFYSGINFWIENDFIANNWHTNEIRNPKAVTSILMLMEDQLSDDQTEALVDLAGRANFNCWGARPGGDQIKIAGIAAELAVFSGDERTLIEAIDIMANEVQISTGNGIKRDLGFHHRVDRVTSILSYGKGYADAFANWAYRLEGTKYQYPENTIHLMVDFYLDGICKSMVHGKYKDPGVMNRGISRKGYLETFSAEIPEKLAFVTSYRRDELKNIAAIRNNLQRPNLVSNKFFWHSEYLSHQREGFKATVRMHSERQKNIEYPHNLESLKMHHYTDGSCFISRQGNEYYDIFPVWDWQKIPGTTIVQKDTHPSYREIVKWGKTDFVGAVSDGLNGTAVFDFSSPHDDLKAQKAWFFFNDEIVALGNDITSGSDYPVYTTLNQCILKGEVVVSSNNKNKKLKRGEHQLDNISWIYHDDMAYLFFKPESLSICNRNFSGNWDKITKQTRFRGEIENKDLFTAWFSHGKKPDHASYAYIIRPGISIKNVDDYHKSIPLSILENSSKIQAVKHEGLGLTQIVFYQSGVVQIGNGVKIEADNPGIVMVKTKNGRIDKISVSDPTRKLSSFQLTVSPNLFGKTELIIPLPGGDEAGKSISINGAKELVELMNSVPKKKMGFEEPRSDGKHYVGEKYGGGVIVWLDEKREHGLIAALEDSHSGIQWKNGKAKFTEHYGDRFVRATNAKGDGVGAGEMNTLLIVAQQTEDGFFGEFAAKVAANCQLGVYGDWYLPSKKELEILHGLKDEIGGFNAVNYWSSTEYNVGFAWGLGFEHYKSEYTFNKGTACAVRCVRKF